MFVLVELPRELGGGTRRHQHGARIHLCTVKMKISRPLNEYVRSLEEPLSLAYYC